MSKVFRIVLVLGLLAGSSLHANESDHGHESDHDHDEQEAEHSESESKRVGLGKGILEANEKDGFKLSSEAIKNFGIATLDVGAAKTFQIPRSAIFKGLEEKNLYRVRDSFYKRIDFKILSSTSSGFMVESVDLRSGDKIVVEGLGFLRIAELAAFGGVSDSHSH